MLKINNKFLSILEKMLFIVVEFTKLLKLQSNNEYDHLYSSLSRLCFIQD